MDREAYAILMTTAMEISPPDERIEGIVLAVTNQQADAQYALTAAVHN